MRKLNILLIVGILLISTGFSANALEKINKNRDKIITLQVEMLALERQRHEIMGKSLDLRQSILDIQKSKDWQNDASKENLKVLRKSTNENKEQLKVLSLRIEEKKKQLNKLISQQKKIE
jgi:hypothetical protein